KTGEIEIGDRITLVADYLADEPGAGFSALASYRIKKKLALRRYRTECAGGAVGRVKTLAAQRLEFGSIVIVQAQQSEIGRAACRQRGKIRVYAGISRIKR